MFLLFGQGLWGASSPCYFPQGVQVLRLPGNSCWFGGEQGPTFAFSPLQKHANPQQADARQPSQTSHPEKANPGCRRLSPGTAFACTLPTGAAGARAGGFCRAGHGTAAPAPGTRSRPSHSPALGRLLKETRLGLSTQCCCHFKTGKRCEENTKEAGGPSLPSQAGHPHWDSKR